MFVVLNLYMLNVDDWMWWLHVLNYVVELLHVNDGDIDGKCMYARWRWKWWWICCWTFA